MTLLLAYFGPGRGPSASPAASALLWVLGVVGVLLVWLALARWLRKKSS